MNPSDLKLGYFFNLTKQQNFDIAGETYLFQTLMFPPNMVGNFHTLFLQQVQTKFKGALRLEFHPCFLSLFLMILWRKNLWQNFVPFWLLFRKLWSYFSIFCWFYEEWTFDKFYSIFDHFFTVTNIWSFEGLNRLTKVTSSPWMNIHNVLIMAYM